MVMITASTTCRKSYRQAFTKPLSIVLALLVGVHISSPVSCASSLEPIPGSITWGGQPRTKLLRAPVGSTVSHRFYDGFGREVHETYRIDGNRNLQLIRRRNRDAS